MTTPADDTTVEDAFEAYLAGRPVPEEAAGLAVFAEAVRATATQPGRPNVALAELLATGLLTDQSSPSARTATSAGTPPPRRSSRVRNRRRFAMIFSALIAKLLSAGAVAQAATGAGVVIVIATGAGATGVLGDDVRDAIVDVVATEDETLAEDDAAEDATVTEEETAGEYTAAIDPGAAEGADGGESVAVEPVDEVRVAVEKWMAGPTEEHKNFGDWVSSMAGDRVMRQWLRDHDIKFSDFVRQWAHDKGLTEDQLESELEGEDVELEGSTDAGTEVQQPADTDDSDARGDRGNRGNRGNGNGHGKANGNGNGNGGHGGGKGNGRN